DSVGMSHVVLAMRSADKQVVERIEEVISVDAVVFPATTVTFQEQMRDEIEGGSVVGSLEGMLARIDEALINMEGAPERVATFDGYVATGSGEETYDIRSWSEESGG